MSVILGSLFRHLLGFAGGFMASKGYIDEAGAEAIVGAVFTLGATGWSIYEKKKR